MGTWWRTAGGSLADERRAQELAALVEHSYSMTWSARSRSEWGIVKPSALAVFRLITSSNFVACSTGRSAGFAPLRILDALVAGADPRRDGYALSI
jgi:hypothetical protein